MPNEAAFIRELDALIDSRKWNKRPLDEVDKDMRLIVYRSLAKFIDGMEPLPDPRTYQDRKYAERPKPPIPKLIGKLFCTTENHFDALPTAKPR